MNWIGCWVPESSITTLSSPTLGSTSPTSTASSSSVSPLISPTSTSGSSILNNFFEYFIVSVLVQQSENQFRALQNSKKGFEEFHIPHARIRKERKGAGGGNTGNKDQDEHEKEKEKEKESEKDKEKEAEIFSQRVEKYFQRVNSSVKWFKLGKDAQVIADIANIENQHRQVVKSLEIALVFCEKRQTNPVEMIQNRTISGTYQKFLEIMGVPCNQPKCLTEWRGHTIKFYLAAMMDEEDSRRYIGNTQCMIIFKESPDQFDPSEIGNAGNVTQFFVIVQPHADGNFRVGCIQRSTLLPFGPRLPSNYRFDESELKRYILTKVHNGYMTTRSCPPLSRMYEQPRASSIQDLAVKYCTKNWPRL